MANPNNLVRPSLLGNSDQNPQPGASPALQPAPELQNLVRNLVTQILNTDGRTIIQNIIGTDTNSIPVTDQIIDERHRNNLTEIDKIPDVVRSLREFSGKPTEFNSWKKSVERILHIYEHTRGTPRYFGILNVIRNKIVGSADIALESYNTPLDWRAISMCLTTHYADKRDLGTLEYQMTGLIQGNNSVQDFYQKVYSHLSLILNKIGCMEVSQESIRLLTETYRIKALDTFVRGLNGDLPRLLGMREPKDLPEALHLCLKLENQKFRSTHANQQNRFNNYNFKPPLPPRNYPKAPQFYPELAHLPQPQQRFMSPQVAQRPQLHPQRPNIFNRPQYQIGPNQPTGLYQYPQGYHNYYQQQTQRNQHYNPPPRPIAQKPQPKPEPMDIDPSIRTNAINYANRPNLRYAGKRQPDSNLTNPPMKAQRNFHVSTSPEETETSFDNEDNTPPITYEQYEVENSNYYPYNYENADFTDIHFLE